MHDLLNKEFNFFTVNLAVFVSNFNSDIRLFLRSEDVFIEISFEFRTALI